jgi:hypothetical protein
MAEGGSRVFSLQEANDLVPRLVGLTSEIVRKLDQIKEACRAKWKGEEAQLPEEILKEIEDTLQDWSERIQKLGAYPKGYFTVDFQSFDPELLYCWTYGEDKIEYTHKVWENFSHRRPLSECLTGSKDHMKWVH